MKTENTFIIEELWAFCSKDEGGEGVVGGPLGDLPFVPLIGADRARVESCRPVAKAIGEATGKKVILKKFKLVGTEEIIHEGERLNSEADL